mgnify:CR=1 FL=1
MIYATVTGRIGKDAVTRQTAKGDSVTGFSIASDIGFGENKSTLWVGTSIWGKRGEALAQHLVKGSQVTVVGELSTEEYEGKTQLKLRVAEIVLQGGKKDDSAPAKPKAAPIEDDAFGDSIPF